MSDALPPRFTPEMRAAWARMNTVLDETGATDTPEFRQAWADWVQTIRDAEVAEMQALILRIEQAIEEDA